MSKVEDGGIDGQEETGALMLEQKTRQKGGDDGHTKQKRSFKPGVKVRGQRLV